MNFADTKILLYLGWIVPAVVCFLIWAQLKRRGLNNRFAVKRLADKLLPASAEKKAFRNGALRTLSILFILMALARPQWGFFWEKNVSKGFDILIALDTSKSMLARDEYPDRLEFAKENIKDFVNGLRSDRVGLIAFAGGAFLQAPLTLDHDGFLLVLKSVDTNSVPRGGTSIAEAIEQAVRTSENSHGDKLLVLITDGENTSGDIDEAIKKAVDAKLTVSSVGIGTSGGGEIPLIDADGNVSQARDKKGNIVRSRLDTVTLEKIAQKTGGVSVKADPEEFGLWKIYDGLENRFRTIEGADSINKVYEERFQVFLTLAVICLMLELLPGKGRDR